MLLTSQVLSLAGGPGKCGATKSRFGFYLKRKNSRPPSMSNERRYLLAVYVCSSHSWADSLLNLQVLIFVPDTWLLPTSITLVHPGLVTWG